MLLGGTGLFAAAPVSDNPASLASSTAGPLSVAAALPPLAIAAANAGGSGVLPTPPAASVAALPPLATAAADAPFAAEAAIAAAQDRVMTAYLYVKANALYGTRISPSQHGVLVSAAHKHAGHTAVAAECSDHLPKPSGAQVRQCDIKKWYCHNTERALSTRNCLMRWLGRLLCWASPVSSSIWSGCHMPS